MFGGENCLWEQMGILPDLFSEPEKTPRWTNLKICDIVKMNLYACPQLFLSRMLRKLSSDFLESSKRPALLMFLEDRCISLCPVYIIWFVLDTTLSTSAVLLGTLDLGSLFFVL